MEERSNFFVGRIYRCLRISKQVHNIKIVNFILAVFLMGLGACVTHDELLNLSKGDPFPQTPEDIKELPELRIQPDDQISIRVLALEMEAAAPYNVDPLTTNNSNLGSGATRPLIGFLVDKNGYIDFPVLGRLKIGGMTIGEVREMITDHLQPDYLKEPVVLVRFLNFRVTVLGEVSAPGSFQIATERITIWDALGLAGDLEPYADRTNITIVREQNGSRTYGTLNLQDRNIFQSPFFYLQQNDFIYVRPLQERTAALRDQSQRVLPYISAGVTVITLILTLSNLR